jgi:hypothetical protein
MGAARVGKSIAFVGISIAAVASAHCNLSKECSLVGCEDGAQISVHLGLAPKDLVGSTFTVCRNGVCSSGVLTPYDAGPAYANYLGGIFLNGALFEHDLDFRDEPDGGEEADFEVQSDFELEPDGAVATLANGALARPSIQDGDVYEVKIVASNGTTIFDATHTATYATLQPNGPDCDPTCHIATIDISQ